MRDPDAFAAARKGRSAPIRVGLPSGPELPGTIPVIKKLGPEPQLTHVTRLTK
jgi:hypothetical protein